MSRPTRDDRTLVEQLHGSVEYAIRANGRMEVQEWFAAQPFKIKAGFDVLFNRLTSEGRIRDSTQFHPVDEMWVFKKGDYRILTFHLNARWLLLHWYKKNRDRIAPGDKDHARTILAEHIQWEAKYESHLTK